MTLCVRTYRSPSLVRNSSRISLSVSWRNLERREAACLVEQVADRVQHVTKSKRALVAFWRGATPLQRGKRLHGSRGVTCER